MGWGCGAATDLINVFEVFLPQLLLYPNPQDPLNGEAAALLMRAPDAYNKKVRGESSSEMYILEIRFGLGMVQLGFEQRDGARFCL